MSHNEQVLQKTIIQQIKDSKWSVKGYFQDLFAQLLPAELLQNDRITVIDELISDTLPDVLSKQYDQDGYVLMFYAHKTHSNFVSPYNHDTNAAHTSLLLCKVDNGKINQVLNIDGYHNLPYMDILGERQNAKPNPYIKNRLVIDAPDNPHSERKPLQSASWNNLNCPLYAFAFAKAILNAFTSSSTVLDNLFVGNTISPDALHDLKHEILKGVEKTYVNNSNGTLCRDAKAGEQFHKEVRETLAQTVQARFDQQQVEKESLQQKAAIENKPPVSVSSSSLFKPVANDASKAVNKLVGHCTAYQIHLYEDLEKLTGKNNAEMAVLVKTHVINATEPDGLDDIIKKCRIVDSMLDALRTPEEPEEQRINNMNMVLTPENRAILAEHRSGGGKFLQAILNVLSAIFSVLSKQEWKYKTEGDELIDNIEAPTA